MVEIVAMAHLVDRDTAEVMALLREAVAASGLSQAAFARALGTSAPRLSTYLTGDTRPSAQFLCGPADWATHWAPRRPEG